MRERLRVHKCAVNVVIAAQGKSKLHREELERVCIRKENPVRNPDDGVFIQIHKRAQLR